MTAERELFARLIFAEGEEAALLNDSEDELELQPWHLSFEDAAGGRSRSNSNSSQHCNRENQRHDEHTIARGSMRHSRSNSNVSQLATTGHTHAQRRHSGGAGAWRVAPHGRAHSTPRSVFDVLQQLHSATPNSQPPLATTTLDKDMGSSLRAQLREMQRRVRRTRSNERAVKERSPCSQRDERLQLPALRRLERDLNSSW